MKFRIILTTITGLMLLGFTTYCGYMVFCHPESPRTNETSVKVVEPPQSGEVEVLGVETDDRIKGINAKIQAGTPLTPESYQIYIQRMNEMISEHNTLHPGEPLFTPEDQGTISEKIKRKMKDVFGREKPFNTIGTEEINP
jgi:hypothetical protein